METCAVGVRDRYKATACSGSVSMQAGRPRIGPMLQVLSILAASAVWIISAEDLSGFELPLHQSSFSQVLAHGATAHKPVKSKFFTTRVLSVNVEQDRSITVQLLFEADEISQAEAVAIRNGERKCSQPAVVIDRTGQRFVSAQCAGAIQSENDQVIWLVDTGMRMTQTYRFIGTTGASIPRAPFDIRIPIVYSKTEEEDGPAVRHRQLLRFANIG